VVAAGGKDWAADVRAELTVIAEFITARQR